MSVNNTISEHMEMPANKLMDLEFSVPEETLADLDPLYNHKTTCELLVADGAASAIANFCEQSKCLDSLGTEHQDALRCIFLNSLNKCLYNYILFSWDISLSACCFQNKALTHRIDTKEHFLESGKAIISNYASCMSFYPTKSAHVRKACEYIKEHLDEDLTLSVVAQNIFLSTSYLSKIFKPMTGESFTGYINRQRLIRARSMLLTTSSSIDQIAVSCGYRSASYFSTAFRKNNGYTPAEFRNKYRTAV